jgi:uncharacterized membrane protein YdbT with pleckstrin-like domain
LFERLEMPEATHLSVTPDFVPGQAALEAFGVFLFILTFVGPMIVLPIFMNGVGPLWLWALAITLPALIGGIIYYYWKKWTYAASRFDFVSDRVVYSESFLNQQTRELRYDRVVEVILSRNVVQRMFGTGTITLQTFATPQGAGARGAGVRLPDLLASPEQYARVREIVAPRGVA